LFDGELDEDERCQTADTENELTDDPRAAPAIGRAIVNAKEKSGAADGDEGDSPSVEFLIAMQGRFV